MKILICGTGKSGTTALTYALKKVFNDYAVIFEPPTLTSLNYQEENFIVKSLQIVQNRLWEKEENYIDQYDKKILIIRNPLDIIVSFLLYDPFNRAQFNSDFYVNEYINILKKKVEKPDHISLQEIVNLYQKIVNINAINPIHKWCKNVLEISEYKNLGFFIFKYEDFVEGKLESLSGYLGIDTDITNEVQIPSKFKRVARSKKHSDYKNWFTEKDINIMKPNFIHFLEKFNYETNMENHVKQINPEDSYLYTLKVINESRRKKDLPEYQQN